MSYDPDDTDAFITDLQSTIVAVFESQQAEGAGLKLLRLMDLLDELRERLHGGEAL
jgi:hypothetical protein